MPAPPPHHPPTPSHPAHPTGGVWSLGWFGCWVGKDGFNNQFSKTLFAGCLWEFAQPNPTNKLNKGALKQRRLGKDGFNNQFSIQLVKMHSK